ncbi:glycosyltransferase family 39 protein, partial [Candidatus Roizmanbacteria bacterium]|nr:glycosyltransferase family 39 protein [Candidatus Roizmanbacteria bacterium]
MEKKKLVLIFLFGFLLRFYGINWDSGFHLHPDERMLIMVAEQIHFFNQLNPHFFNYGSLPIYLLKGTAQLVDLFFSSHYYSNYEGLLYVGRSLSILFDLGTIFLIYKISHLLFFKVQGLKSKVDYLSSFFYAIMFFPIQNSHFFTVDLLFTFLSTLLVYNLLLYRKKYSYKYILFIAVVFSALFATKFTAIIFLPMALLVLIISNKFSLYSILHSLFFILSSLFFSFILMPYAFLDFSKFWADISPQLAMSKDPYIFPYTLQYVGTTPYLNYLKNIFLWGLGPIISILSLSGVLYCFINFAKKYKLQVFFLFYAFYFLSIGISTVKFMRYMFPMYPFFAIMAGFGLIKISKYVNI